MDGSRVLQSPEVIGTSSVWDNNAREEKAPITGNILTEDKQHSQLRIRSWNTRTNYTSANYTDLHNDAKLLWLRQQGCTQTEPLPELRKMLESSGSKNTGYFSES